MIRRPILLAAAALAGLVLVSLLALGAFPPEVSPAPVERVLPNDRFRTH